MKRIKRGTLDFDIQRSRIAYPTITRTPWDALSHLYCIIGNGYEWVNYPRLKPWVVDMVSARI